MTKETCQVAIIGAGPYGLSAAAHLRSIRGLDVRVFGECMSFWERNMPAGMLLRSYWDGSHISDPHDEFTLDRYQAARGVELPRPVRLDDFVDYGRWVQRHVANPLDARRITRIEPATKGFRLTVEDGDSLSAQRVVIATGIASYVRRPPQFDGLPSSVVSHSSEHRDLRPFADKRVAVVGGGQSALESAALLREAGAEVEVLVRALIVHWLRHGSPLHAWLHADGNLFGKILYPPSDIGPPGINWLVDQPDLFKRLPMALQERFARRAIRPAGAGWLRPRMGGTAITIGRLVTSAKQSGQQVRIGLDDGTERQVDHVLLATGYKVDVSRCSFLGPELLRSLRLVNGYPELTPGFEASVPGLHFVGATAAGSFGPLMRFVAGTKYASRALARCVRRQPVAQTASNVKSRYHGASRRAPMTTVQSSA
jgi:FAD-dependent urate hydroxylase